MVKLGKLDRVLVLCEISLILFMLFISFMSFETFVIGFGLIGFLAAAWGIFKLVRCLLFEEIETGGE